MNWKDMSPEQKEARLAANRAWRKTHKGTATVALRNRRAALRKIGWSIEAFDAALTAQGGRCAICTRELDSKACADHDHETGKARALLCQACNISLGYYEKWQRPAGLRIEPYEAYRAS